MRSFGTLLILSAVACGGTKATGGTGPRTPLEAKEIAARSSPSIVLIEAGEGTGTGFIVDRSGLVATNLHVVAGNEDVKVKLFDGNTYPVTNVVGLDPVRDLAILKIAAPGPLPALRLGDSDRAVAGEKVVTIGNPLGVFANTVSDGLVSQVRAWCSQAQVEHHRKNQARYAELTAKLKSLQQCVRSRTAGPGGCDRYALSPAEQQELTELRCTDELTLLQISVPISQGSSGGPLFNLFGEVIGVTTAIVTGGQNINIAIPSNYVKPMVARQAPLSMQAFAAQTRDLVEREGRPDDGVRIQRLVPDHALSIFQGCKPEQIAGMVLAIEQAIDVGAPLYNKGEIEACFRIYEGTAIKFERDSACAGIRDAFADGLERAKTLDTYKEKAWAMRDTFDGLIMAARKWAQANASSLPGSAGTPGPSGTPGTPGTPGPR